METITIKRCPSWNKCSEILGALGDYERGRRQLETSELFLYAGMLRTVVHAKAMGAPMPKDWDKCHPSTPYQLERWADKIEQMDRVRLHNDPPFISIEIPLKHKNLAREFIGVPAQSTARKATRYVLYEYGKSIGEVWSKAAAQSWVRQG